jgi:hypothetical protein
MRLLRVGTGTAISFHRAAALASGGEGCIYPVPQDPSLLAKIYHQPSIERSRKLALMVARPIDDPMAAQGHVSIAWPIDLLRDLDRRGEIVGFVMRRVNDVFPIVNFYNPSGRRQSCPLFNWRYLHQTARNLAAAFAAIHKRGDLVADVNSRNILASPRALITLVDTDSFQVRDPNNAHVFRCPVGTGEYTPPELQNHDLGAIDRKIEHDCFGLAIVLFQLLMEGTHPFAGTYLGGGDPPPYEERIRLGHFPYAERNSVPYRPMPIAPPLNILYPLLQHLFVRCFEEGFHNPAARPGALAWQNALEEAEASLVTCAANPQHRYAKHSASCPWCERKKLLGGRDPFPSTEGVQRGEHLQPRPGVSRHRPQPQRPNFAAVFTSRLGPFGLGQTYQSRYAFYQRTRSGVLHPVPMRLPHPAQHPIPAHARAQRQHAISSAVAVVITAGFGLAVLSVGDWRVRVLSAGVALMALFGPKLFRKYPNLLSMAGVGYTGFTLLMVAGVLASFVARPSFFGSSRAGVMFLLEFLFILGFFSWRATSWRLTFFLKYAIFAAFALIGALVLSTDVSQTEAMTQAPQIKVPRSTPSAPASQNEAPPRRQPLTQASPSPPSAVQPESSESKSRESLRILGGGASNVSGVAWSPDGRSLARAAVDNTVSIWDARSGAVRLILHPADRVSALAWSFYDPTLATGSTTGIIELWDTRSGSKKATLEQSGGVVAMSWCRFGSLASGGSADIVLWNPDRATRSTLEHAGNVTSLAWEQADGRLLASTGWDKTIKLWNSFTRKELVAQTEGASTPILTVAWSPDGKTLASAGGLELSLWNVFDWRSIWKLRTLNGHEGIVTAVAWHPSGTVLASAGDDHRVILWDTATWTQWRTVSEPRRHIRGLAWSPDGTKLAINTTEALIIWDVNQ